MADATAVSEADVYKGDRLAATLRRTDDGVEFSYREDYLAGGGAAVATTLPLQPVPISRPRSSVPPFFAGLLPEGVRLTALVSRVKTSVEDELSLLVAVGADTIGDVRVVPSGTSPEDPAPLQRISEWDTVDLGALFAASVGLDTARVERTALSGVQEKASAQMMSFPTARFFVKLSPPRYPRLVENEAFFIAMAGACGLRVPHVKLVHDRHGASGLLVTRFDRAAQGGGTRRLAQEDGCQLLDRYPGDKYLVRYLDIARRVVALSDYPTLDGNQLVQVYAFSYLIGNGDLHAKNISLGCTAEGEWRLTPNYDLLSTLAYIPDDPMALEFEGRQNNLERAHVLAFAGRIGVGPRAVERALDRMCDVAPAWIDRLAEIGLPERATRRVAREIRRRREALGRPADRRLSR